MENGGRGGRRFHIDIDVKKTRCEYGNSDQYQDSAIRKMAEKLSGSKVTINRAVKGLKEKNLIQRERSAKTGKWIILK